MGSTFSQPVRKDIFTVYIKDLSHGELRKIRYFKSIGVVISKLHEFQQI